MSDSFSKHLFQESRLFDYLHEMVTKAEFFDGDLSGIISSYLSSYSSHHQLSIESVAKTYSQYITTYNEDIQAFLESGKYPPFLEIKRPEPDRTSYSIILILSTLLTRHRFRIMQLVQQKSTAADRSLFVGCGPGLELALVKDKFQETIAYDLELDPFLRKAHPSVDFRETLFTGQGTAKYDSIFLIELLEHLDEPLSLLANCARVLSGSGELHLTTATNLPQWDHRYNFPPDHAEFERQIEELGLVIKFKEIIPHVYLVTDLGSKNHYYILEKRK